MYCNQLQYTQLSIMSNTTKIENMCYVYILLEKVIDVAIIAAPLLRYFRETSRAKRIETDAARLALEVRKKGFTVMRSAKAPVVFANFHQRILTRGSGELLAGLDEACGVWTAG